MSEITNTLNEYLSQNELQRRCIPFRFPHWENRSMRNLKLTFVELSTVLYQIQTILNSRSFYRSTYDKQA